MSLERRFALLPPPSAGAWIIEDDYDGEFCFDGRPLPTLKSVDTTGRVIYVGTFSKSLFPSLRLGYLLAPPPLVAAFERFLAAFRTACRRACRRWSPSSSTRAISPPTCGACGALRRAPRGLCEAAARRLDGLLDVVPSQSGLHTIGHLRAGWRNSRSPSRRGADITVSPIARYCIDPVEARGLVLGFSAIEFRA